MPQVLFYFNDETDVRLAFDNKDDEKLTFATIILNFAAICPEIHLKVYGVPDETLQSYKASGKKKYVYDNQPDDKFRLKDLEVETAQEYESKNQ